MNLLTDHPRRKTASGLLIVLVMMASTASAQPEVPGLPADRGNTGSETSPVDPVRGSDLLIRDVNGELQLLKKNINRAALIEWLNRRELGVANTVPRYDIVSVSIDGTADDKKSRLTVKLKIQIHDDKEWVSVPVGFEGATVEKTQHTGPGEISLDRTNERERRWWFRKAGQHELTLSLIAGVRVASPIRRLQLNIPSTASSQLTLRVPMERVTVIPPEGSWVETTALEQSETQIKLVGLGSRLNLQWRPQANLDRVSSSLQVECRSTLELTTDPATLTVAQTIKALQGSFQEFDATLPNGYELKKIEETIGSDGPVFEEFEVDPSNPREVKVRFREPVSQAVRLVWTLDREETSADQRLKIEPIRVQKATIETGEFEIVALQGFRFEEAVRADIRRVTQPARKGYVSTRYRYSSPKFRLQLDVVEVAPLVIVEPVLLLRVFENSMQLDALYRFQLRQGAIDRVELDWPEWRIEGWEIQPVELLTGVAISQMDLGDGPDPIALTLQERQTGSFEVRLRATRKLDQSDELARFHLPRLLTTDRQSTSLLIVNAENVETQLDPLGETVVLPLSVDRISALISYFPEYLRSARQSGLRIDSVDHHLQCEIDIQPQSVNATSRLELLVAQRSIRQVIEYSVEFEALDEIRLLIPEQLMPSDEATPLIRVSTAGGTVLPMNGGGLAVGNQRRVRYQLPERQLGQFKIVVEYPFTIPDPDGELEQVRLPIIRSADGGFSETQFFVQGNGMGRIRVNDSEWAPQAGRQPEAGWATAKSLELINLEIGTPEAGAGDDITVTRALVRTWLDADGFSRSRAQYRIEVGDSVSITVALPDGLITDGVWWNQEQLRPRSAAENPSALLLALPSTGLDADSGLLTIDFHRIQESPFDWSESHQLEWPSLPDSIWIDQTIWEVVLPSDQHLFTTPAGYTPQFQWTRAGIAWQRTVHSDYRNLNLWIQSEDGPAETRQIAGGNSYEFLRLGPARPLEFRTMKWWAIIFCGAGLTWIVGVILLKVPATRHILTIPILATTVAGLAIWYPSPVQLFLQPAMLGILLAFIMAWIDSWAKQDTEAVMPLGQPPEFGTGLPAADSALAEALGVNTEESTAIRPPSYSGSSPLENSA